MFGAVPGECLRGRHRTADGRRQQVKPTASPDAPHALLCCPAALSTNLFVLCFNRQSVEPQLPGQVLYLIPTGGLASQIMPARLHPTHSSIVQQIKSSEHRQRSSAYLQDACLAFKRTCEPLLQFTAITFRQKFRNCASDPKPASSERWHIQRSYMSTLTHDIPPEPQSPSRRNPRALRPVRHAQRRRDEALERQQAAREDATTRARKLAMEAMGAAQVHCIHNTSRQ